MLLLRQKLVIDRAATAFSIAEYSIDNTIIRPTYMLTYESASELLHLNLEEEAELKILSEAAALRLRWRREQVEFDVLCMFLCFTLPMLTR